jgi:hypothetical protein
MGKKEEEEYQKQRIAAVKQNLANTEREMKAYPEKIKQIEKSVGLLERKVAVKQKLLPIVLKGIKRLDPQHEYEKDPEFIECQKELETIGHAESIMKLEQEIQQTKNWLEVNAPQELDRLRESKVKCIEDLRKSGVEV